MDNEYIVLDQINSNASVSQRSLAEKTGLSLGSMNLLIKKMVKEGLIKMETIPANRVMYMLTPQGVAEKANKTYKYIKNHYSYIHQTKERIKEILDQLAEENQQLCVMLKDDEIGQLVQVSIDELGFNNQKFVVNNLKENEEGTQVIVTEQIDFSTYSKLGYTVLNLIELL